jgi:hypothetical protein
LISQVRNISPFIKIINDHEDVEEDNTVDREMEERIQYLTKLSNNIEAAHSINKWVKDCFNECVTNIDKSLSQTEKDCLRACAKDNYMVEKMSRQMMSKLLQESGEDEDDEDEDEDDDDDDDDDDDLD